MCDTNSEWELLTFNAFLCGRLIMTFSLVTEISTSQHQNPLFGDNRPFSAIREASVSQAQGHSVSRLNTFIFDIFRTGTNGQNGHLVQVFMAPRKWTSPGIVLYWSILACATSSGGNTGYIFHIKDSSKLQMVTVGIKPVVAWVWTQTDCILNMHEYMDVQQTENTLLLPDQ